MKCKGYTDRTRQVSVLQGPQKTLLVAALPSLQRVLALCAFPIVGVVQEAIHGAEVMGTGRKNISACP